MRASLACEAVLAAPDLATLLDVGEPADGPHATAFTRAGKAVCTVNLYGPATYVGSYPHVGPVPQRTFDAVWASHVLEHQRDPGRFLDAMVQHCRDEGLIAVTVPPEKPELVGGHLTTWTPGRLLYHLVLAGLDCSEAQVMVEGYNISVLVRKKRVTLPTLAMDAGDLERLAPYFPTPVWQGCDGRTVGLGTSHAGAA